MRLIAEFPNGVNVFFFVALRNDIQAPLLKFAPKHRWITAGEAVQDCVGGETHFTAVAKDWWHKTKPGDSFAVASGGSYFNSIRLDPSRPANTLPSVDKIYHWAEPRSMTFREWKRLGSFPDDYHAKTDKIGKYIIGMSVPPKMTEQVARAVIEQWLKPEGKEV